MIATENITWRLDIICKDPNIVGNKKKEERLIKQFDRFYEVLEKSFRHTLTYELKLLEIKREVIRNGT